jgi:hypothetical protein
MAKRNPDLDLIWLLFKRDYQGTSRITGGDYWRLHWYCFQNGEYRVTDVDSTMKNFRNWADIVKSPTPWGGYNNLKKASRTRSTRTWDDAVINADSEPELIEAADEQSILQACASLEQQLFDNRTQAQQLFDFA